MSLKTTDLIFFEKTKSISKHLEIVFIHSENFIGVAVTLNCAL